MRPPISRRAHAVAEFTFIPTVAAAPELFGFADEKVAATACRALSGAALASSAVTRAEWGLVRVMPYSAHVAVDIASGLMALAAPWLCGFAGNARARNTFLAIGATAVVAGLLSLPAEEMPADAPLTPLGDGDEVADRLRHLVGR
ncbi:MAG: hypothetical protein JWO31_1517 [Phycisphaerales bacterium]|nr:hypothetical protein [Phycisphaerales bacterium]